VLPTGRPPLRLILSWLLRLFTCAALAVDAYVHADLAHRYDPNRLAILSQGDLFRIEAGVSGLAAFALLLTARHVVWMFAFAVAASALGAILVYRYTDIGSLGPFPDMYEPLWYPEKTLAASFEAAATVAGLVGFALVSTAHRGRSSRRTTNTITSGGNPDLMNGDLRS
jgi:hypothetical protein